MLDANEYQVIQKVMYDLIDWFCEDTRADVFIEPLQSLLIAAEKQAIAIQERTI